MSSLEITADQQDGQIRLALAGELDIASTPEFEEGLAEAEGTEPAVIVLDLRKVEFIDSTGLRAVIAADERARNAGRRFVVVRGTAAVERVFSVTQLDQRLEIVDDPAAV